MGLMAMIFISIFQATMMAMIFEGVGLEEIWDPEELKKIPFWRRKQAAREYLAHNSRVSKDYLGFIFFCATD